MGQLFRFETRKIIRQKSFYICFGISFLILVLNAIIMKISANDAGNDIVFSPVKFSMSAIVGSSFIMLLGIFTALYCCDDVSNNTMKNIYSKGYSRAKVFFAKYIVSLSASLIVAIAFFLISFMLGKVLGNADEAITKTFAGSIILQLLVVVGYHAVYFSLAMIIGKVGGSVALNIVGPMLVFTVLSLLASLLKIDFNFSEFWLDSLINPLSNGNIDGNIIIKAVLMPLLYSSVFVTAGYFMNRKKEM